MIYPKEVFIDNSDKRYISEYDIEIERKEEELKEIYRKDGESRYMIFVAGGGIILPILLIPVFIWMITDKNLMVYGIVGVTTCIITGVLAIIGKKYHDNKMSRLESEITKLKEKKKAEEQKYLQYRIGDDNR